MLNTVAWFEVGTDDPDGAQRFYGDLFGWTFATDPKSPMDYRLITQGEGGRPSGGVYGSKGEFPNYAIFSVLVEDVEATCARVESLGGKVIHKVISADDTSFAYLKDVSDNLFGVFTPPAG